MTQAFNLGQLANNLNTSGQLDATDGLYGVVPVANGGIGQSSLTANNVLIGNGTSGITSVAPGTSGNALVSNGSAWTSGTIAKLNTATGNAPSYSIRAWVNFDSNGTINDSRNVSSVTKFSIGNYAINFATAMNNTAYSAISNTPNAGTAQHGYISSLVTTAYNLAFVRANVGLYDPPFSTHMVVS